MQEKDLVIKFYNSIDEESRLGSKTGQVEYITTMKYIHQYLKRGMKILDIGAGIGRYSIALAREGYNVEAIELVPHNIEVFKSKLEKEDSITVRQGDAINLSMYHDNLFDITLCLGPMYHLFDDIKKGKAMEEAIRVTKRGGIIFIAYCMNEATILQYCFKRGSIMQDKEKGLLSEKFHWTSNENDAFSLMRIDEILTFTENYDVTRLNIVATDGAARYMEETVDSMDDEIFQLYLKYHLSTCERKDLIGASNHTLDILCKK